MPLFYFHLRTPGGLDSDEDGLVMADLDTAYLEACASIPGIAAELVHQGLSPMPYTFVIANAAGEPLMEVPFAERLHNPQRTSRLSQSARARRLSVEIADVIGMAHETAQRSREILARARASS